MIKTASDEDLHRIASRLFETIRGEFMGKFLEIDRAIEGLRAVQWTQGDRITLNAESASKQLQSVEYRLKQVEVDIETAHVALMDLAVRAKAAVESAGTRAAADSAARARLQGKLDEVLAIFARWENDLR